MPDDQHRSYEELAAENAALRETVAGLKTVVAALRAEIAEPRRDPALQAGMRQWQRHRRPGRPKTACNRARTPRIEYVYGARIIEL